MSNRDPSSPGPSSPADNMDRTEVFGRHYDELIDRATAMLRKRGLLQQMSPQTVVHGVYAKGAHRRPAVFEREADLINYLTKAMLNAILDSLRMSHPEIAGTWLDGAIAAAGGRGTATEVGDREVALREAQLEREIEARLIEGLKDIQVELVRRVILRKATAKEAAEQLGMSADNVRQRVSQLRGQLRAQLLEPLRGTVDDPMMWSVIQLRLIEKLPADEVESQLGMTDIELLDAEIHLWGETLAPALGVVGLEALKQLIGRR